MPAAPPLAAAPMHAAHHLAAGSPAVHSELHPWPATQQLDHPAGLPGKAPESALSTPTSSAPWSHSARSIASKLSPPPVPDSGGSHGSTRAPSRHDTGPAYYAASPSTIGSASTLFPPTPTSTAAGQRHTLPSAATSSQQEPSFSQDAHMHMQGAGGVAGTSASQGLQGPGLQPLAAPENGLGAACTQRGRQLAPHHGSGAAGQSSSRRALSPGAAGRGGGRSRSRGGSPGGTLRAAGGAAAHAGASGDERAGSGGSGRRKSAGAWVP